MPSATQYGSVIVLHRAQAMLAPSVSTAPDRSDDASARKRKRPQSPQTGATMSRRRNHVTFNSGVVTYHVAEVHRGDTGHAETVLAADNSASVKIADGPRPESILLNDLILAFFERGQINGPEDLRMHLTVAPILLHKQVEVRLRRVVETIADAADGHAVGLLPSNVRLSTEHLIHLTELLGWMAQLDATGGE